MLFEESGENGSVCRFCGCALDDLNRWDNCNSTMVFLRIFDAKLLNFAGVNRLLLANKTNHIMKHSLIVFSTLIVALALCYVSVASTPEVASSTEADDAEVLAAMDTLVDYAVSTVFNALESDDTEALSDFDGYHCQEYGKNDTPTVLPYPVLSVCVPY